MEVVWAMVVTVLGAHFPTVGLEMSLGPFDEYAEVVDAIVSRVAQLAEHHPPRDP
jgi:hypothetical protein